MIPGMNEFKVRLVGAGGLLMHNERLANPTDAAAKRLKALTGKRGKTDEDHEQIARAEWEGGLYWDVDIGPYISGGWISAVVRDSAKLFKLGTAVTRGVLVMDQRFKLEYDGPRDIEGMWAAKKFVDQRMVGNQAVRVLRTRPLFEDWHADISFMYDTSVLDASQLQQVLTVGGFKVGIGDYRPRFGRFNVEFN